MEYCETERNDEFHVDQSPQGAFGHNSPHEFDATSDLLLDALRRGDPEAYSEFVRVYTSSIRSRCRKVGLNPHDSDDVCQEVMKALPAGVKRYQKDGQPESFRRWLSRIVQRKIIDFHRRSWKQPRGVGGTEHLGRIHRAVDEAGRPDDSCLPRDIPAARLTKVLECVEQKVSAATWKAFWMMTVNDYTSTEVSALLDISPNAVRLARARVLQALRATLERGDDSFGVMSPSTI